MKGNIYSRLWIPKPCHEDWYKMTPDEKGAFCKSCNKSVYDFTNKNEEQVEAILASAKGKEVCGRFDSTQLASLPELEIPLNAIPNNLSPYRKFILAVFIVFGTALFGCVNTYGQRMGKVRLITQEPPVQVTEDWSIKGEVVVSGSEKVADAQTKAIEVLKDEPVMGDTVIQAAAIEIPPLHLLGGVTILDREVQADTKETENAEVIPADVPEAEKKLRDCKLVADESNEREIAEENIEIITGGIPEVCNDVKSDLIKILPVKNDPDDKDPAAIVEPDPGASQGEQEDGSVDRNSTISSGDGLKLSIECYPNPSTGPVNIRYQIKKRCDVRMELFDRSGRKVKTLIDREGHYNGIYSTAFDLSDLVAGTYICVLNAGGELSSAKVVITK
jgi:hypothetical protein